MVQKRGKQEPAMGGVRGEEYHTGRRIWGGSYVERLNPDIVSTHIDEHLGAKHLPFPLVEKTTNGRTVAEQDKGRRDRIFISKSRFPK